MNGFMLILAISLASGSAAAGQVVKCIENGKTTFSDRSCSGSTTTVNPVVGSVKQAAATQPPAKQGLEERANAMNSGSLASPKSQPYPRL